MDEYPLSKSAFDKLVTKTGKHLNEINIENVMMGNVKPDDIKISKEVLLMQGKIAERYGRHQMKENFTRASELTDVPDEKILEIYESLRPFRSTKEELINLAYELRDKYNAINCANLILEAVEAYEKRNILRT
ncbi:diol dehydratase small subunit [Thermoanaerobacterium thermosaccharolyticum]|uniref:diol dehydratase small subunit n=1 Tax=Thermoanaerobacterium thermosaccharolyticum TaxID=1517 RepID=UPI003D2A4AC1